MSDTIVVVNEQGEPVENGIAAVTQLTPLFFAESGAVYSVLSVCRQPINGTGYRITITIENEPLYKPGD